MCVCHFVCDDAVKKATECAGLNNGKMWPDQRSRVVISMRYINRASLHADDRTENDTLDEKMASLLSVYTLHN